MLLLVPLLFISIGCKPNDEPTSYTLEFPEGTSYKMDNIGGELKVPMTSNISTLKAQVKAPANEWMTARLTKNSLILTVAQNAEEQQRSGTIEVQGGGLSKTITLNQAGTGPYVIAGKEVYDVDEYGGDLNIEVSTNRNITAKLPAGSDWLEIVEITQGATAIIKVKVNALSSGERTSDLTITSEDNKAEIVVQIHQKAGDTYTPASKLNLPKDVLVPVVSATASSSEEGDDIENAIDGEFNDYKIYHSSWDNYRDPDNYFPITLEFNFKGDQDMDYIIYYPRTNNPNGNFKQIEVWGIDANSNGKYEKLFADDLQGSAEPSKLTFNRMLKGATKIKIVIFSGSGERIGFAAASEIEFYEASKNPIDLSKYFTDNTASALKAGITDEDIAKIEHPVIQQIARHLKAGTYPREFRIEEYKAYPDPVAQMRKNHTSAPLSILDNPTGIGVKGGDELLVFVGDTHGEHIQLCLLNYFEPGGDGFDKRKLFRLQEGINQIEMPNDGLLYVMYNVPHYKTALPVKIHFATGGVNGYFDISKHKAEDFTRLLDNAKASTYFDVLGKYAHLAFPVADFQRVTGSRGMELIETYDQLVHDEFEFMGLMKYNRVFGNRVLYHGVYRMFMYATAYHTAYNVSTVNTVLDPDRAKKENWGPAHELGHQMQTIPGFKWHGMTEVTNNVHSLWIQTSWGSPSRIQTDDMTNEGGFKNRYDKAYNFAFIEKKPYQLIPDVFCRLVPLWQLQLYFSNVLGYEDFYKDLYELIRQEAAKGIDDEGFPGAIQTEFIRRASKVSGYDLTGFFEAWGFNIPMKSDIDDYGSWEFEVTSGMVDAVKSKVASMNLKTIPHEIKYISDANWIYYKNQLAVSGSGAALISGTTIEIPSTWKNAVAFECYADGELIGVSNNMKMKLSKDTTSKKTLYAIAFDGKKTEVPVK